MDQKVAAFDPTRTYVHLLDGGVAAPVENTPSFWQELMADARSFDGRLLTSFKVSTDMAGWEMHPAGDEVLLMMSGAIEVLLDFPDGTTTIPLQAGDACIVPKGVWHRFKVRDPGTLIFITAGVGTQHRSL